MTKDKINKIVDRIMRDIRIGLYQVIVLKIITEKQPIHGYAIRKRIVELTNGMLNPSESTIYDTLKKLEKLGLIEGYWAQSPLGGPMRKYYKAKPIAKPVLEKISRELEKLVKNIMAR